MCRPYRDPGDLTTEEQAELALICQRSATTRESYQLTQQFMSMLRLRHGQEFEIWLAAVEASHIPELRRFAHSLRKRQRCRRGWADSLVQQWTSGGPSPQAQIGQVLDVWSRQVPLLKQRLLHTI